MKSRRRLREQAPCPHCGEYIPTDSSFCRHCGSDRETGWADDEEIAYQAVELPEEESDERDGAGRARQRWVRRGAYLALIAMAIAVGLVTIVVIALARGC
jgi:zinc ribbon protein